MVETSHNPLKVLTTLRQSKKAFHDKLCRASAAQDPLQLQKLRSENIFVLSEFFYLLQVFDMVTDSDRFVSYIQNHNAQLQELMDSPEQRRLMGLEVPRLKYGLFSQKNIDKALANLRSATGGLDQADVQRLTIMLFSPETGRRMIELLETCGFIERIPTPYQSVIIKSNGFVERCFLEYLDDISTQL